MSGQKSIQDNGHKTEQAFWTNESFLHSRHTRRALIWAAFIEIVLIILLARMHFPVPPQEKKFEVSMQIEEFDFNQLPKPEREKLPDIEKYLNTTARASNEWQDDFSDTEMTNQQKENTETPAQSEEETGESNTPTENSLENTNRKIPVATPEPQLKLYDEEKSYKGVSRIKYYVPGHHKKYLRNPLFTCPDNMHGWVRIDVVVDRSGRVLKAKYNPRNSTTDLGCLVDTALRYSKQTQFDTNPQAPEKVYGYILYLF